MTTPTKPEMKLTDEMIVDFIQIELGWTIDGTAEANDMLKVAYHVVDHYESHLATLRARIQERIDVLDKESRNSCNDIDARACCESIVEELGNVLDMLKGGDQ